MGYRKCDRASFNKGSTSTIPIANMWNINGRMVYAHEAIDFINGKMQNLKLPPWSGSIDSGIRFLKTLGVA